MNTREATLAFIQAYRKFFVLVHHSHTHKKSHRTDKKLTNLMGNLCCAREHSVQFFVQVFLHSQTAQLHECVWSPLGCIGAFRVYGALQGVWGPFGSMGLFRVYGAL